MTGAAPVPPAASDLDTPAERVAAERVAAALAAGVRRLRLRGLLERGGWGLLGAVLLCEVVLALRPHAPGAALGLALVGGLAVAIGLARAWRGAPSPALAAAVLDAGLGGAALSTAAEALAGAHPRFGGLVLAEAATRLEGRSLRALVPLRAPAGLLLGGAAAALLPTLLVAPASARAASAPPRLPSLLSPQALAGGAGGPGAEAADVGAGAPEALTVLPAPAGLEAQGDPLNGFAPEVADLLRERLQEAARALPGPGSQDGGPRGATSAPSERSPAAALEQALSGSDPEAALAALARAAEAAAHDRAAALRLRELADRLGPAGAGAGTGPAPESGPGSAPAGEAGPGRGPESAGAGEGPGAWSPEQRTAVRRYFAGS